MMKRRQGAEASRSGGGGGNPSLRLLHSCQLARVVGRPLLRGCGALLPSTKERLGLLVVRALPSLLHFFHRGELLDVWQFPSEVVEVVLAPDEARVVVATAEGRVWVLPLPLESAFKLQPTFKTKKRTHKEEDEAEKDQRQKKKERRASIREEKKKEEEEEIEPQSQQGTEKGRRGGKGLLQLKKTKQQLRQPEETKKQTKKKNLAIPESKEDDSLSSPDDVQRKNAFSTAGGQLWLVSSRTSSQAPLMLDYTLHTPFILAEMPSVECVLSSSSGVYVSSSSVGISLFDNDLDATKWGTTLATCCHSRNQRTTCMLVIAPSIGNEERLEETQAVSFLAQDSGITYVTRLLFTALFGQALSLLNTPVLVHGDADGRVAFVPCASATNRTEECASFSSSILCQLQEPVQNVLVSGDDMFLVIGKKGKTIVLTADGAQLHQKEFELSISVEDSCCTANHVFCVSTSGSLYLSSLPSTNTSNEGRRPVETLFPRSIPFEKGICRVTIVAETAPVTLGNFASRSSSLESLTVTALTKRGRLISFALPSEASVDRENVQLSSIQTKNNNAGQRVKTLLQTIASEAQHSERIAEQEQIVNQQISSVNSAIHLVLSHALRYIRDGDTMGAAQLCTIEAFNLPEIAQLVGVPQTVIRLSFPADIFSLFTPEWCCVLQVKPSLPHLNAKILSHWITLDKFLRPRSGSHVCVEIPLQVSNFHSLHIRVLLCYHLLSLPLNNKKGGVTLKAGEREVSVLDFLSRRKSKMKAITPSATKTTASSSAAATMVLIHRDCTTQESLASSSLCHSIRSILFEHENSPSKLEKESNVLIPRTALTAASSSCKFLIDARGISREEFLPLLFPEYVDPSHRYSSFSAASSSSSSSASIERRRRDSLFNATLTSRISSSLFHNVHLSMRVTSKKQERNSISNNKGRVTATSSSSSILELTVQCSYAPLLPLLRALLLRRTSEKLYSSSSALQRQKQKHEEEEDKLEEQQWRVLEELEAMKDSLLVLEDEIQEQFMWQQEWKTTTKAKRTTENSSRLLFYGSYASSSSLVDINESVVATFVALKELYMNLRQQLQPQLSTLF